MQRRRFHCQVEPKQNLPTGEFRLEATFGDKIIWQHGKGKIFRIGTEIQKNSLYNNRYVCLKWSRI